MWLHFLYPMYMLGEWDVSVFMHKNFAKILNKAQFNYLHKTADTN